MLRLSFFTTTSGISLVAFVLSLLTVISAPITSFSRSVFVIEAAYDPSDPVHFSLHLESSVDLSTGGVSPCFDLLRRNLVRLALLSRGCFCGRRVLHEPLTTYAEGSEELVGTSRD